MENEHGRRFCPTCLQGALIEHFSPLKSLEGRKVFLFEQLIYPPHELQRHHDLGDTPATVGPKLPQCPPHARCAFCKRSFYCEEDVRHVERGLGSWLAMKMVCFARSFMEIERFWSAHCMKASRT